MNYLGEWGHLYLVHTGFWVTFVASTCVAKQALPKDVGKFLKKALKLSIFLAFFSSHAHQHMSSHFMGGSTLAKLTGK